MRVALLDFGIGNLHSLTKALERGGAQVSIETDSDKSLAADALVLPGVGSFGAAIEQLRPSRRRIRERLENGLPCLGVCLGMQLLFEESDESPGTGLGLLTGRVRRLRAETVPQMGWNLVSSAADPLFTDVNDFCAYYANSYVVEPLDPGVVIGWSEYGGDRFAAAVRRHNTWGVQFHPEKSGDAGLCLVRNFLRWVERIRSPGDSPTPVVADDARLPGD